MLLYFKSSNSNNQNEERGRKQKMLSRGSCYHRDDFSEDSPG